MPTYEYFCDTCSHSFDIKQRFQDDPLTVCPSCNQETIRKVFHASGIVFKGSGFYKTDSQDKSKKSSTRKESVTDATTSKEPAPTTTTPPTTPTTSETSSTTPPTKVPETSSPSATPSNKSSGDDKASS